MAATEESWSNGASQQEWKGWWNWRVAFNLIGIGFAMGLFGYDNAFTSPLVSLPLFVAKYQGPGFEGAYAFTAKNLDLLICVPLIGAAMGAFVGVPLQRWLGRQKTMLVAYALFAVPGSFLQLFAPNMAAMIVGRLWNNFGISILTSVVPLFMSELVPAHARGRAVGLAYAGSGASSVLATVVVWASAKINSDRQYRIPLAVQAGLACVLLIASCFLTESPTWLISKGRNEDARKRLLSLRNHNERMVEKEMYSIAQVLLEASQAKSTVRFKEILNKKNWTRTFMASSYLPSSQVCGQSLAISYSTVLFVQAGVSDAFQMTVLVFLLQFVGNLIGPFLADRLGRRPVALSGLLMLLLLDTSAGGLACGGLGSRPEKLALAALSCIFAFINAACFQSLAYILPTEIPDAKLREPTMTWTIFWSYATAVITSFATPQIINPDAGNLGAKAYLVFGGCVLIVLVYSYFLLPELAGRTLAEINELYERRVPPRKWKKEPRLENPLEPGPSGSAKVEETVTTKHIE